MYGYSVVINSTCLEKYREPVEFGEWREEYINVFSCIQKNSKSPDIVVENDIPVGETCYVVWVEYSQGDSFGWGKNYGVEPMYVTTSYDVALEVMGIILENSKEYDNKSEYKNSQIIPLNNGETLKLPDYFPWCGYFERLERVHVETAVMG